MVSFKRAKKILPLLQKESAGPYSDTTVKDGIILPKVGLSRNMKKIASLSPSRMTQLVVQVTYREDVGEEGRESETSIQDGEEVKNKRSLGLSSRQTSTLSQVREKKEKFDYFLNLFFQLNPSELLALTCVGEDDRKIIEEVKVFLNATLVSSVLCTQ